MRLAYFTPLPPSKSGIADYNAELLPYLARGADITVFVEQAKEIQQNRKHKDFAVFDVVYFDEIDRQTPFDLCVYHQGNNPYHDYIYDRAIARPGLVVLHEHCLHHLIAWKTLGRNDKDGYWNEMFYDYGRRGARLAEMRTTVGSEYQQFLMPLNRRLIGRSLGLIVHNEYAASQLESDGALPPVEIFPHHLSPKAYELGKPGMAGYRRLLNIPQDSWVISSHGFVTQSKRIPIVLAAFKRLLSVMPNALYLIVGEDHWRWSVAPIIEEMGLNDNVRITGYTSERDFFRYLNAVDVIVNLRYPTAGETSGTLIRSLGAGKPVIVSDFGQFGDLPDDICLKVAPGPKEEKELYTHLRSLAFRPVLRESLSNNAKEWARRECDINLSAARYLTFAERIIEEQRKSVRPAPLYQDGHDLNFKQAQTIKLEGEESLDYIAGFFADDPDATGYLQRHGRRILDTVELVPVGDEHQRLLELSSYLQMTPLVRRYGDYGEIVVTNWWQGEPKEKMMTIRQTVTGEQQSYLMYNVDVERDRFPFPDDYFDVALCCELIEHLTTDPMHMIIELNRVLKWGGILIVTTPNIVSAFSLREAFAGTSPYVYGLYNRQNVADRHNREYSPREVGRVLEAGGFKVIRLFTENNWHETDEDFLRLLDRSGISRGLRGDNIFAVGRKLSTQFDRYPDGIYD